jgi:hypothetical protein
MAACKLCGKKALYRSGREYFCAEHSGAARSSATSKQSANPLASLNRRPFALGRWPNPLHRVRPVKVRDMFAFDRNNPLNYIRRENKPAK